MWLTGRRLTSLYITMMPSAGGPPGHALRSNIGRIASSREDPGLHQLLDLRLV